MTVYLHRESRDIPEDSLDTSVETWICVGGALKITDGYIAQLIREGWRGTERIPSECVIPEVRSAS